MSEIGKTLKDIASQRRPEDYQEVLELFTHLQEHGVHDSDEDEAVDLAQTYLDEVEEPKEERLLDKLMGYIKRKDVNAVKEVLDKLSRKLVYGSGLTPEEEQAKETAKQFVFRIQNLGKLSSN